VCLDRFPHWNFTITAAKLYARDKLYLLSCDTDSGDSEFHRPVQPVHAYLLPNPREAYHTTKMGSPTLVLITHFLAEIMLIAFLNQGCEGPSSGFKCHLTADVAECIRWIYALFWHNSGTNTTYVSDDNTWDLANNLQRTVGHTCMTRASCLATSCPHYILLATSYT
jgi:hypothetical protein